MRKYFFIIIVLLFMLLPVAASAAQVTLAWDANDPVPQGYRLYQRLEGDAYNYTQPAWTGTATTCTITDVPDGGTSFFVVRAYDGDDVSGDSNEVSFTPATGTLGRVLKLEFNTAWLKRTVTEYYGTTDQTLECSWPAVSGAEGYEVVLHSIERNTDTAIAKTSNNSITFTLPRTGHYTVKVRACHSNYTECTEWASSDDPSTSVVDGQDGGWAIYGTVAGPGSIIIE